MSTFFPVLPAPLLTALLAVFVKGLCTVVVIEVLRGKLAFAVCTNVGRKSRVVHGGGLIICRKQFDLLKQ